MKIAPDKAREIFKRAVVLQRMIIDAMDDLKQLRTDEIEALVDDGMDKDTKKAIRADLSEIIALAKIEAKVEQEKAAAKMAHRREVAEVVGVQLDMLAPETITGATVAALSAINRLPRTPVLGPYDGALPPDDMPDLPPILDRRVLAPQEKGAGG